MAIKLFILGRPGSGKSTASRFINEYLGQLFNNWSIVRYCDYDILYEMFLRDKLFPPKKKRFEEKELGGFDVLDFTVLDEVLRIIEKTVRAGSHKEKEKKEKLVIIEFARQDYNQALSLFSDDFLRDSYFLFLDTDVKICVQRVKDRITIPPTPDNHFVSEYILTSYYGKQVIPSTVKTKKGENVAKDRIKLVSNQRALHEFNRKVKNFTDYIIADSSSITQPHPKVQLKLRRTFKGIPHLYPLFFTVSKRNKTPHGKTRSTHLLPQFPFKKQ